MPRPATIAVYLEKGRKRTFACAVEWPGWSRVARGDPDALDSLAAYGTRYARVVARSGLEFDPDARLEVVETLAGDAMTDFGAPGAIADADRRRVSGQDATRLVALLDAAWDELDAVAASSQPTLRKGPRGGGRDRDAMVAHVVAAERSYARKLGIGLDAAAWREGGVLLLRDRIREVVGRPSAGESLTERGWPVRYAARRIAWHVLDHAWEMEDRRSV